VTTTGRDPNHEHITEAELTTLITEFQPRFRGGQQGLVESWTSFKKFYRDKNLLMTEPAARRWLQRDLERDGVLSYRFPTTSDDPLAESHPQQSVDLDEPQLRRAVTSGDLHNWYFRGGSDGPFDEARQSLLPADKHAASCPRCQAGIRSRQSADALAIAAGKKPFPSFGDVLKRFEDHKQRCDDCGVWEDEPAVDSCPRSFWHLPDIYLALHPGQTLEDMGTLGPFMRGFLRRQRA
jgi:hypothetical protein